MADLRQAAQQALDALDSNNPDIQLRAALTLRAALAAPQPLTLDQVSMIWSRVYPAQPLSQNVLNLVREVEAMHGIGSDK